MKLTEAQSEDDDEAFDEWLRVLKEDVIQAEYGYEEGEFTVYADLWRPDFDAGRSPSQAFESALRAAERGRKEREAERRANWRRIQEEDRAALSEAKE